MKTPAAPILRRLAHIRFATAKTLVPVLMAAVILFASQLVMAAPPEADFDFTPGVAAVGQQVSFSASAQDPDGDIVSIDWDFENDGQFDASGANVQHMYGSSGTKSVRMVVTDAATETAVVIKALRVNAPPNAAFDFSPSSPSVNQSISFDASDTSDDAAIGGGGFDWDFDADGAYDDASGQQVTNSYSTPGNKTVGLRVTDSEGETSTTSHTVPVSALNAGPSAAFDFTPTRPNPNQTVSFDGSGSSDDGPLLPTAYAWDFDNDGQFDDALGIAPSTSYPSAGARTVSLRVTDALGVPDTVSHTVTVNAPPTASFDFSPASPEVSQSVAFDASDSGDDLSLANSAYAWDFDNNGSTDATGEQVNHAFGSAGSRTVRLTVTDSGGLSTSTTRTVTVAAQNTPPVPSFVFSPSRPNVGQSTSFDAGATSDDETIPDSGFDWDFDGNGSTDAEGREVSHSFSSAGARTVGLRVTDADGASATTTRPLTVNAPPNAAFSFTPSDPDVGDTISFNAAASTDDLALANSGFAWDLDNDGQFDDSVGPTASGSFATSGSKTVRLQVTDSGGSTDVTSQTVQVAANPAPVAAFTFTPARPNLNQVITLSAASSTDDEPIPAAGYTWDLDNDGAYDDSTGVSASGSFATAGAHTVGLRVADADGTATTTSSVITVNAAPTADFTFTPTNPSRSTTTSATVTFNGTATDDLALPAGALAWDTDNDNQFDDGTTNQVTATYATSGAKIVRFRVTDSGGSVTTVQKTVTVNTIPVADFTITPQTPRLNEAMTLSGAPSSDADAGQTRTYAWDFDNDGQFDDATGISVTRPAYTTTGEKVLRLRVTDSLGATAVRERRIEIQQQQPSAGLTSSPAAPLPGQTVTFTSTSTPSPGAAITSTEWNLDAISGFEKQGSTATAVFRAAGRHTVEVKVTEDSGGIDIYTAVVVVNSAPTAQMRFSPSQPYAGDTVSFASVSRDADGFLSSETWDLDGDGQFDDARGKVASKAFTSIGAHTVRLRAVDNHGAGAVHAVTINVRAKPVAPPELEQLDSVVRITSAPGKSSTRITRLGVRTSKGAMVRASCKGDGCPAKRASSTRSRGKTVRLRWLERRLPAGTRIRIYVTAKGKVGSYTSLLIRRAKLPSRRDLCLSPGTTKTIRCPR